MHSRGQAALDLLLALVVLLVVLASLEGVLSSFASTQKEIGIHQQLDEQARVSALFLSLHSRFFHESHSYPTKGGPSSFFVDSLNDFISSTGSLSLSPVRASGYPQGVGCVISVDWSPSLVQYTVVGGDAGLGGDVVSNRLFSSIPGFDSSHSLSADGCASPLVLEAI